MKKFIVGVLVLVVLISVAECKNDENEQTGKGVGGQPELLSANKPDNVGKPAGIIGKPTGNVGKTDVVGKPGGIVGKPDVVGKPGAGVAGKPDVVGKQNGGNGGKSNIIKQLAAKQKSGVHPEKLIKH